MMRPLSWAWMIWMNTILFCKTWLHSVKNILKCTKAFEIYKFRKLKRSQSLVPVRYWNKMTYLLAPLSTSWLKWFLDLQLIALSAAHTLSWYAAAKKMATAPPSDFPNTTTLLPSTSCRVNRWRRPASASNFNPLSLGLPSLFP
jgi:hypothetical protein